MTGSQRLWAIYGNPNLKDFQYNKCSLHVIHNKASFMPKRIYINKDMIEPLESSLKDIIEQGLEDLVETYDGCYNNRPQRGAEKAYYQAIKLGQTDNAAKYLSCHAFAMAIDINRSTNELGQKPTLDQRIVAIFKKNGFTWGGDFKRMDGMHFEFIPK